LAAAACSSSNGSAGSSTSPGGSSTGAVSGGTGAATGSTGSNAQGSTIEVGVVSADTSYGVHSNDVPTTVTLWQNWVNSRGRIGGHPVQVIEKDTQGSASTANSIVNGFAQDKNIIAIFDNDPSSDGTWAKTAAAAGLPVICMTAAQSNFTCQSQPNFFPAGSSLTTVLWAQSYLAKLANVQNISFFACAEAAQCATAVSLQKGWAKENGIDTVYSGLVSQGQPSYAAPCLAAKSAGATGVVLEMAPTAAGKMADDCAAQSYHPTYTITSPLITPQNLADSNLNGTISDFSTWPWTLTDTPA
jgi:branched-chain amino acid transport system substrate-binding protein